MRKTGSRIISFIFIILIAIALMWIYNIYKENYFKDFRKAEYTMNLSEFKRDREITVGKHPSYKISSNKDFNDAMIYKTITVEPNTPYKLSCMVKTKNVITENENTNAGAQISILDTTESSISIKGTNDWQELEILFNSKSRTSIDIGFRLGSFNDNCMGTAWFSDAKLEVGVENRSTEWNFACFIFESLDIKIGEGENKKEVKTSISAAESANVKSNMERLKSSVKSVSGYNMSINYDIIPISTPITSISYQEEHGYYVSPNNVFEMITPHLMQNNYDYIFIVIKFSNDMMMKKDEQDYGHWIGLGGMDYLDIGFSNIRLPADTSNPIYKFNYNTNGFPEEVYLHEFLHTLERLALEHGYERPELHDYEKYGYINDNVMGQRDWYRDYMTQKIKTSDNRLIGIHQDVYKFKPTNGGNFINSMELKFDESPNNIIEEIRDILTVFSNGKANIEKQGEIQ